jgi:hypothetical protein
MSTKTVCRVDRLRTLESEIQASMEVFFETGLKLKEIRDNELFREDGFETWDEYCRKRWSWSRRHCNRLIVDSEYRAALPVGPNGPIEWTEATVRELTRLEDKRDAAKVAAKVVKAVAESAQAAAADPEVQPLKLTAGTVRKFVDKELGIDRGAQAREMKAFYKQQAEEDDKRREERAHPLLHEYLEEMSSTAKRHQEKLATIPAATQFDTYTQFQMEHVAAAYEAVAQLLREKQGKRK